MPSMTKAEMMRRLREERREQGLEEVRGIWAPKDQHEAIKKAAERIIKRLDVKTGVY